MVENFDSKLMSAKYIAKQVLLNRIPSHEREANRESLLETLSKVQRPPSEMPSALGLSIEFNLLE